MNAQEAIKMSESSGVIDKFCIEDVFPKLKDAAKSSLRHCSVNFSNLNATQRSLVAKKLQSLGYYVDEPRENFSGDPREDLCAFYTIRW